MRLFVKIVGLIIAAAVVGGLGYLAFVFFIIHSLFSGLAPGPAPWSDPADVPLAFSGKPPAGLPPPSAPTCPADGIQPIRGPNPTGQALFAVLLPWYGIPALFRQDPLLKLPVGAVTATVTDPYGSAPKGAWIAAIREDGGRFVEQAEAGTRMVLPVGRYRLRAAISSNPVRWGEVGVTVTETGDASVAVPLDQIAPAVEPVAVKGPAPAGSPAAFTWANRGAADGLAVVARVGARGKEAKYARVRGADGVAVLDVTATQGQNVASYLFCAPLVRAARWIVDVGPSDASVGIPPAIRGGDALRLPVRGSFRATAHYDVTESGGDRRTVASGFIAAGGELAFTAPLSGGDFELSIEGEDGGRLVLTRFAVTPVAATVIAPKTAAFRKPVALGWATESKAAMRLDLLPYGPAGWPQFRATEKSTVPGPVEKLWKLPPGKVAVRLVHDEGGFGYGVAETVVEVTGGPEFLAPPATARAGSRLDVAFSMPARDGDRVALVQRGYDTLDGAQVVALAAGATRASLTAFRNAGDFDLVYATVEGQAEYGQTTLSGRVPLRLTE